MFLHVIKFIGCEYHEKNLFHGDIKPDNIFFRDKSYKSFKFTTDLGSLLYLGEQNEIQ